MSYNFLGFALLSGLVMIAAAVIASRPSFPFPPKLFMGAVALRILGSTLRYEVLQRYYDGVGDASGYYATGLVLARQVWALDFSLFSVEQWMGGARSWWGTAALWNVSGIVLSAIGPTMRGEFLAFALLAFSGLVMMAVAVYRLAGRDAAIAFATVTWLWPSLWFWPSSIGKESIIVFAFGLVVLGYTGFGHRLHWVPFTAGLAVAFAIRPHVALSLAVAAGLAHWMGRWHRMTPGRVVQLLILLGILFVTLRAVGSEFGLIDADLEGVQEFVSFRAQQTLVGGSSLGAVPRGVLALPRAFINIWLRPLPWDIHNSMALLSALEVALLWVFVWFRRRDAALALHRWRHHRLLQFAVPFLVGYTLMIGLTFGNLGIIARQRSPLFPFVFLVLSASWLFATKRTPADPNPSQPTTQRPAPAAVPERRRTWARP